MTVARSKLFAKHYARLPETVQKKVDRIIHILCKDIRHPGLHAKKMKGADGIWEARVDYHFRVTFQLGEDSILFRDVGTHEIYKKT
jgi:mRNA-degrading endonuclease RelE of RelBE toxin-antitoxin system